ncbi:hypothetical protein ACFU44_26570 [Nocardia rhizosphaerihabitans]|uniref:hypothetical protein n=1 Tax=Nocardia rhizosphaerihabitans TaxID=1691570 RepID=UPI00366C6B20
MSSSALDRLRGLLRRGRPAAHAFATTPLRPEFAGEHLAGNRVWRGSHVTYLGAADRARFRLSARDGLLYTADGTLFDTTEASTLWSPSGGRAIFVMDADGLIYSSPRHLLGRFHHSSFLAGCPVAAAGELVARNGRIILVSDHSTHYRPARRFTNQILDSLRAQGIPTDAVSVEFHFAEQTGT